LTGSFQRGVETGKIMQKIIEHKLDVTLTGMLLRAELAKIYNQSKLLIKMGGGQNDRSVLEAMACGCFVLQEFPRYSAPFTRIPEIVSNQEKTISAIKSLLFIVDADTHINISTDYMKDSGMSEVIIPNMEKLFNFFKKYPKADKTKLIELMGVK